MMAEEPGCSHWECRPGEEIDKSSSDPKRQKKRSRVEVDPVYDGKGASLEAHLNVCSSNVKSLKQPKGNRFFVPWNRLPEVVMERVMKKLDDRDRCSASQVCWSWRKTFRCPSLWRTRHFAFRGFEAIEQQERYHKFMAELGSHVQHLNLELSRPNLNTASIMAKGLEVFVNRLVKDNKLRLLTIKITPTDFMSGWYFFSPHRGKVVRSLCSLLKKQTCLRSADLSYCQMDRDEGSRVLEALAYGSRQRPKANLSHVDLRQFFSPRTRAASFARFGQALRFFTALVDVRVDLKILNDTHLKTLTDACSKTLRSMELDAYTDEIISELAITSTCWRGVSSCCPLLGVYVLIHGLCDMEKYATVLVPGIPLKQLGLVYLGVEDLSDPNLNHGVESLLRHLASLYHATLTKVSLQTHTEMELEPSSAALLLLVERCQRLSDLSLNFPIQSLAFLQMLQIIQRRTLHPKKGPRQTRLNLNVRGMTPELYLRVARSSENSVNFQAINCT